MKVAEGIKIQEFVPSKEKAKAIASEVDEEKKQAGEEQKVATELAQVDTSTEAA